MDLTILIPVKNEINNILEIINSIEKEIQINYEILFIDDFSEDNTYEFIRQIQKKNNKIKVVKNKINGLGQSIRNGIKYSNGKYLSILMCDGSDDPSDLNRYYNEISKNDLDAVFGSRFIKYSKIKDYPKLKLFLNRVFNYFVSLLYLNAYNDYTNAFKIYKKKTLIEIMPLISESFNIFLEIPLKIISRNYSYELTSINWFGRKKGSAKFKIKELRSKYLFTLIYCFIEKILLKIKK